MSLNSSLKKQVASLTGRVMGAEKRINDITQEFGSMLEMLALWRNAYYAKDQDEMYELAIQTQKLLEQMREKYG